MATVDYVHHLAFPKLSDSEVECLAGLATICSFKDGELVFQAGQRGLPFYVVESGEIAIVDESTDVSKTRRSRRAGSCWSVRVSSAFASSVSSATRT
jgi:CRP-like cAMP-binding protein